MGLSSGVDAVVLDAVVLDAHLRTGVAGIRALGRAGLKLAAVGRGSARAGCRSRYAAVSARVPPADTDPDAFAQALVALIADWGSVPVYPGSDATLDALLAIDPALPGAPTLPYPSTDPVRRLRDKRQLPGLAREAGLLPVESLFEGRIADLEPGALRFPCVVKSSVGGLDRSYPAASHEQLGAALADLDLDLEIMIQDLLYGPLIAVTLVLDREGRTTAGFQQETVRTWPAEGGSSSVAVGVEPEPQFHERCASLLRSVGYWGLAEFQFMRTAAGPRLIDVNPRYYGSMPLAVASGVNLPAAWHAAVVGEQISVQSKYRPGRVFRWLEADLVGALRGDPSRLRVGVRGARASAMWALDDPMPGVLLALDAIATRAPRVLGRAGLIA